VLRDDDPLDLTAGSVIRGGPDGAFLTTAESDDPLSGSSDQYPQTKHDYQNITDLFFDTSYTEGEVEGIWDDMVDFALGVDLLYDYEIPASFDDEGRMHIANSMR
jgi:hypothetical protein